MNTNCAIWNFSLTLVAGSQQKQSSQGWTVWGGWGGVHQWQALWRPDLCWSHCSDGKPDWRPADAYQEVQECSGCFGAIQWITWKMLALFCRLILRGSDSPVVNVCNSAWMEKEDREFELKECISFEQQQSGTELVVQSPNVSINTCKVSTTIYAYCRALSSVIPCTPLKQWSVVIPYR